MLYALETLKNMSGPILIQRSVPGGVTIYFTGDKLESSDGPVLSGAKMYFERPRTNSPNGASMHPVRLLPNDVICFRGKTFRAKKSPADAEWAFERVKPAEQQPAYA